jgi:hypothetical protein
VDKEATLALKLSCASYSFVSYHPSGSDGNLVITDPPSIVGEAKFAKVISKNPVPGSLNKKGGRRFHLSCIFCLIKDGTLFPLRCLMNPALLSPISWHCRLGEFYQSYW